MGKRYLRTIVSDFQTLTASADITPVDLPVNPLSHLLLTIEGTAAVQTTTANYSLLADFLAGITDLSVRHRGENIIQGSLADLMMMAAVLHGRMPFGTKLQGDGGAIRTMTFVLPFGRKPFWGEEAFPATTRGQLRFHMTAGAVQTAFTARRWALEAVELVEDNPSRYLKYTTLTRALTATGRQRVPLPLGNQLLKILLFDPTTEVADAADYAFQKVKILKDNVEQYYAESNWESLRADLAWAVPGIHGMQGHTHFMTAATLNQTAVADVAGTTEEEQYEKNQVPTQYGLLDFDPHSDGAYALDTAGVSTLDIDLNSDVSTGTVRFLPVELIST